MLAQCGPLADHAQRLLPSRNAMPHLRPETPPATQPPGCLVYLIGPSGSGKDSLLRAAAEPLEAMGARIATRLITRPAGSIGEEQAVGLDPREFQARAGRGEFALHWHANQLDYAISREIDDWLAEGRVVVVNGSRGHLREARRAYPGLLPILLRVDETILRQRLLRRGRETFEQIEARLQRSRRMESELADEPGLCRLDNSGPLENGVRQLLALIDAHRSAPSAQTGRDT